MMGQGKGEMGLCGVLYLYHCSPINVSCDVVASELWNVCIND